MARRMDKEGISDSAIPKTPRGSFKQYVAREKPIIENARRIRELEAGSGNPKTQGRLKSFFGGAKSAGQKGWGGVKSGSGKAKTIAVGAGGFMGGLAVGAAGKGRSAIGKIGSNTGTMFLFFAFFVYLIDLWGGLGGRYTGFQWIWGFDNASIITNIVTSSIFGTFMLIFLINKVIRKEWETMGYESLSFGLFAFVMTFFIMNNQWFASPKATLHLIFILVFGFTFIRSNEEFSTAYIYITVLLLIDFFGYSLLQNVVIFRYIPLLFLFVIFYINQKTQSRASIVFLIIVIIMLFIFAYKDVEALGGGFEFITDTTGPTLEQTKDDFFDGVKNIFSGWQATLSRQIQYAISGKVEENQFEPIGVYLERVESADPIYYTDENVIVWGTVKVRTLDDQINVKVGCYVKKDNEKIQADNIDPDKTFPVFAFEEKDFACTFNGCTGDDCKLRKGTNTITTFAKFNFETLAYLKTYFINRERLRAMTREGLNVFDEFKITDRNPISVYTNGPVSIGMETTSPLTSVSEQYIVYPRFSLSLQNRVGWEGKINKLKELVLFFPKGVELVNPAEHCNKPFKKYELINCTEGSCVELNNECTEVCKGFLDVGCDYSCKDKDGDEYDSCFKDCKKDNEEKSAYTGCNDLCDDSLVKCEKECEFLFGDADGEYTGYSLDIDDKDVKKYLDDFEKLKRFDCRFRPDPSEVLGNAPLTTKFFRVKARYDYTVEKPVTVKIVEVPDKIFDGEFGEEYPAGWPTPQGKITQGPGGTFSHVNLEAVDIGNTPTGTPVYATHDGVVIEPAGGSGYGIHIDIESGEGFITRYAHLSESLVNPGDVVSGGDLIGKVGSTGTSTAAHLHYEFIYLNMVSPYIPISVPACNDDTGADCGNVVWT